MSTLAERVRWILDETGWSARELARRAALKSESHVGLLLKGKTAKNPTLDAIAKAVPVNPTWLIHGHGEPGLVKRPPPTPMETWAPIVAALPEPFPRELLAAIGTRPLYPATEAALRSAPKVGQSRTAWHIYIDLLETANRMLELSPDWGDVGSAGSAAGDVVRSPMKPPTR